MIVSSTNHLKEFFMNYSDGIEVHLHDIVVVDYVESYSYDEYGHKFTNSVCRHQLGEIIDIFPENKKCFLISILNAKDSISMQVHAKKCNVKLADYRDLVVSENDLGLNEQMSKDLI